MPRRRLGRAGVLVGIQGWRQKWNSIAFEKKMAMFVAPVFVAVVSGVLIQVLSGAANSNSGQTESPPTPPATNLELIDLAVGGGHRGQLSTEGSNGLEAAPDVPQFIDVTLRNSGSLVSVVKRASLRVVDFGFLEICEAGGGLEPSEEYNVVLPPRPQIGDVVEVKVSQEIPPNDTDRFTFQLSVPPNDMQLGTYLYQLEIAFLHDTESVPVQVGTVLVSVPYLPDPEYFDPAGAPETSPVGQCYRKNRETFARMLRVEGERSPNLSAEMLTEES